MTCYLLSEVTWKSSLELFVLKKADKLPGYTIYIYLGGIPYFYCFQMKDMTL